MRDCIDRRSGPQSAMDCDDANRAFRARRWPEAERLATEVARYFDAQGQPGRADAWREQAAEARREGGAAC
jgi:hypothetical protein